MLFFIFRGRLLAKIRHYVTKDTLHSIYFGIFSSILTYGSQIWGQIKSKHFNRLVTLQNKAVKVLNFSNFRDTVLPLYKISKILKLSDSIRLQNFMYVLEDIKGILPPSLQNTFILSSTAHTYKTRSSIQHKIKIPTVKTTVYGIRSIKFQSCQDWNYFINYFKKNSLHEKS